MCFSSDPIEKMLGDDGGGGIRLLGFLDVEAADNISVVVFLDAHISARVCRHRGQRGHPRRMAFVSPSRPPFRKTDDKVGRAGHFISLGRLRGGYHRHLTPLGRRRRWRQISGEVETVSVVPEMRRMNVLRRNGRFTRGRVTMGMMRLKMRITMIVIVIVVMGRGRFQARAPRVVSIGMIEKGRGRIGSMNAGIRTADWFIHVLVETTAGFVRPIVMGVSVAEWRVRKYVKGGRRRRMCGDPVVGRRFRGREQPRIGSLFGRKFNNAMNCYKPFQKERNEI